MKKIFDFLLAFLAVLFLSCSNVFNDDWEEDNLKDEGETVSSSSLTVYSASSTTQSDYTKFWLYENKTQSYTFSVTSGNTYYIQYADYNSYYSLFSSSNSYSCARGKFRVTDGSGNEVSLKYNSSSYSSSESTTTLGGNNTSASSYNFTANSSGTYKISFRTTNSSSSYAYYSGDIYFRIYSSSLTVNSSYASSTSDFTTSYLSSNSSKSYTFYAESGYTYYIQLLDSNYRSSYAYISSVSVTNSSGSSVSTYSSSSYSYKTYYFTPSSSGTYTVTLNCGYTSGTAGVYVFSQYNDSSSSSSVQTIYPTSSASYTTYNITSNSSSKIFKFYASAYTTYYIRWQDSWQKSSSSSYTCDVKVSASDYESFSTTQFNNVDSGYNTAKTVSRTSSGYIYIKVEPYSSGGTFGLSVSTN